MRRPRHHLYNPKIALARSVCLCLLWAKICARGYSQRWQTKMSATEQYMETSHEKEQRSIIFYILPTPTHATIHACVQEVRIPFFDMFKLLNCFLEEGFDKQCIFLIGNLNIMFLIVKGFSWIHELIFHPCCQIYGINSYVRSSDYRIMYCTCGV